MIRKISDVKNGRTVVLEFSGGQTEILLDMVIRNISIPKIFGPNPVKIQKVKDLLDGIRIAIEEKDIEVGI
jgi:hypothetical protein